MKSIRAENMDEYIAGFPRHIQTMLEEVRAAIKKAAPEAAEAIKYDIPTFTFKGNLVSFGAWKNHIGLYPAPRDVEAFQEEISAYGGEKSTIQFPVDQPLPLALIDKIVKYRVKKALEKARTKAKKKVQ